MEETEHCQSFAESLVGVLLWCSVARGNVASVTKDAAGVGGVRTQGHCGDKYFLSDWVSSMRERRNPG